MRIAACKLGTCLINLVLPAGQAAAREGPFDRSCRERGPPAGWLVYRAGPCWLHVHAWPLDLAPCIHVYNSI